MTWMIQSMEAHRPRKEDRKRKGSGERKKLARNLWLEDRMVMLWLP